MYKLKVVDGLTLCQVGNWYRSDRYKCIRNYYMFKVVDGLTHCQVSN